MSESTLILCPYCGELGRDAERCGSCSGLFEPLSQKATQIAMGPWFIRNTRKPFQPGCSYDMLRKMINSGRVKPMTVLRGPTTRQFWALARNVAGVAHLLGYCHKCGSRVEPVDPTCISCGANFFEPNKRDKLGLLYRSNADARAAEIRLADDIKKVEQQAASRSPASHTNTQPIPESERQPGVMANASQRQLHPETDADLADYAEGNASPAQPGAGGDLLDQVLGAGGAMTGDASPSADLAPRTTSDDTVGDDTANQSPDDPFTGASPQSQHADRNINDNSDDNGDPAHPAVHPAHARANWSAGTWMLIAGNIIGLALIGLLVFLVMKSGQ